MWSLLACRLCLHFSFHTFWFSTSVFFLLCLAFFSFLFFLFSLCSFFFLLTYKQATLPVYPSLFPTVFFFLHLPSSTLKHTGLNFSSCLLSSQSLSTLLPEYRNLHLMAPPSLSLYYSLFLVSSFHTLSHSIFFLFFLALSDPHPGRSFSWKTVTHFSCISFFFVLKQTFLSQEITLANYGQWSAPLLRITTKKHVQQRCDLDFSHTLDLLNNLI